LERNGFLSDLIDLMDDFKDRRGRFQVNAKQRWLRGNSPKMSLSIIRESYIFFK
jgi:hypothetical protein